MNDSGVVVGLITTPGQIRAFRWSAADGTTILPPPPGITVYRAREVNNNGVIVGGNPYVTSAAWRYADSVYTVLTMPQGTNAADARGVNNAGDIVGIASSSTYYGFFLGAGSDQLAPLAPPWNVTSCEDINAAGQMTGQSFDGAGSWTAFRWTSTAGTRTLNSLIDPNENLNVLAAYDVNLSGQIIAWVFDNSVPHQTAVLLTPTGAGQIAGDIDGDGDVDFTDQALFVAVLLGDDTNPDHVMRSNLNGDAWADGNDVAPFVAALIGG